MDIIKRLQLNRNPKDIDSGSIVGAKNIMFDPISSSITNEYGFSQAYEAPEGFKIVGAIPCNEEIVIFLYDTINEESKIQRLKDNLNEVIDVESNWKWEGGIVEGSFSYNYKKQLILAVIERNVNKKVPLKVFNLDEDTNEGYDNLEIPIPKFYSNYTLDTKGQLICGVYTFFIRIKINNNNDFTKWIQITNDIFIVSLKSKESPNHLYLYDSDFANNSHRGFALCNNFANFFVNENGISNKNININIEFSNSNEFEFELGYIVKRNNEVLGRIKGTYKNNINNINIYNNDFEKECSINDFLEEPHQFYNVQNAINYNNRLYISNYNENENEDLQSYANNFIARYVLENIQESTRNISFNLYRREATGVYKSFEYCNTNGKLELSYNAAGGYYFIQNKNQFIENYLIPLITNGIKDINDNDLDIKHEDKTNYIGDYAICLNKNKDPFPELYDPDDRNLRLCIYNTNDQDSDLTVDNYIIKVIDKIILFESENGDIFTLNNDARSLVNIIYKKTNKNTQDVSYFVYLDDTESFTTEGKQVINSNFDNIVHLDSLVTYDILNNFDYLNKRTLIPGQIYSFYIHFVRKDFSYTNGFKIPYNGTVIPNLNNFEQADGNFKVPLNIVDKIIKPVFIVRSEFNLNDYIGYFFTYEDIETSVDHFIILDRNDKEITNSSFIYQIDDKIIGNKIYNISINDKIIYNEIYRERHVLLKTDSDLPNTQRISIINSENNLYNKKIKTLYRLTELLYIDDIEFEIGSVYSKILNSDNYILGFYNTEKIINFKQELLIDSGSDSVYNKDGSKYNSNLYVINGIFISNYSNIPLDALSIKEDYDKIVKTYTTGYAGHEEVFNVTNNVLSPYKLKDFLELKESYKSKPIISYTNFLEQYIDEFNKTIYRSDVISDENLSNGFRHFNIENYKNILENKGNIINLVGVGLYLLVHTEYSLFVFDRNNQLTDKAQLQIPDTFDIDYKELTPSTEGFGGLKYKEESIITKQGYIWFDRINKSILLFDGQKIRPLSSDIHNLLSNFVIDDNYVYIRFAEDYISNRLLITLRSDYIISRYITLSYSFDTNTFISLHDYTFDKNYKTYKRSYIFNKSDDKSLYVYNKNTLDYWNLDDDKESIFTKIKNDNDDLCSYIDIIFTDKYELSKTLNSISYILSKNNDYKYTSNIIDQYFNTDYDEYKHQNRFVLYSGFKLYITTDLVFSGELDISQNVDSETGEVLVNDSKSTKPYWNKGIWNFNNFRENLLKSVTDNELNLQNVNNQMRAVYDKKRVIYNQGYDKSDMRGLIIGKYFIFRFVFERNAEQGDLTLKFETLDINISKV